MSLYHNCEKCGSSVEFGHEKHHDCEFGTKTGKRIAELEKENADLVKERDAARSDAGVFERLLSEAEVVIEDCSPGFLVLAEKIHKALEGSSLPPMILEGTARKLLEQRNEAQNQLVALRSENLGLQEHIARARKGLGELRKLPVKRFAFSDTEWFSASIVDLIATDTLAAISSSADPLHDPHKERDNANERKA